MAKVTKRVGSNAYQTTYVGYKPSGYVQPKFGAKERARAEKRRLKNEQRASETKADHR